MQSYVVVALSVMIVTGRNSIFWVLVINVRVTERTCATDLCVYMFFPNRVIFAPKLLALLSSLRTLSKSNLPSSSVSGILVRCSEIFIVRPLRRCLDSGQMLLHLYRQAEEQNNHGWTTMEGFL
jgi:hypothetical protein